MKSTFIYICTFVCAYIHSTAQIKSDSVVIEKQTMIEEPAEIYALVEQMPAPPDGFPAFFKYVDNNIVYPISAKEAKISGKCFIKLVVEIDGALSNLQVLKGLSGCSDCDNEAIRVVKSYPKKWIPGRQKGIAVRTSYTVVIRFQM